MEVNLVSIHQKMNKEVVLINNGILFSHNKRGHPAICDNIDGLEGIILCEIRERQIFYHLTYMYIKNPEFIKKIRYVVTSGIRLRGGRTGGRW